MSDRERDTKSKGGKRVNRKDRESEGERVRNMYTPSQFWLVTGKTGKNQLVESL
jgi:hypothetical protein